MFFFLCVPSSFSSSSSSSWNDWILHFFFLSFISAFVLLVEGWFRRDDGGSVSSGALTERERERERIITYAHAYTCENKAIFLFVFLSFRVIGK